jgi:hypothetical protein
MPSADLAKILQVISLLAAVVLVTRLLTTGLWRRYPIFFWYFVFRIPNSVWPVYIKNPSHEYEHIYIATEPFTWIFHVLVVAELYRLVLQRYRGIYSLLRWAMYGSLAVAIPISVVTLLAKIKPAASLDSRLLGVFFATQRGIDFALAIFLILILFFLSQFPVRLNRNILLHATLYTVFFLGNALTMFLRIFAVAGHALATVNAFIEALSAVCIFAWVFLLSPKGEEVLASFPTLSPRHEEHALRQLESLNATLLKVSRK